MSRFLIFILIGIIIGCALGYLIFAQSGDGYIPVKTLISAGTNQDPETLSGAISALGDSIKEALLDLKTIRRNIIITALAGGLAGAFLSLLLKNRR